MKVLFVNADDFNLTPGVSKGIFRCFDCGIVSSTSIFINLPLSREQFLGLRKRKHLGQGLHLNMTYGQPVQHTKRVKSLVDQTGSFKRFHQRPNLREIAGEYRAQLNRFFEVFGKMPDHLDTHHHIHADPSIFAIVQKLSRQHAIPMRRVCGLGPQTLTTDYFFGSIGYDRHWTLRSLTTILKNLPDGASELMCHPGYCDGYLRKISSFNQGRAVELSLFSNPKLKQLLKKEKIVLSVRTRKSDHEYFTHQR
ncbi:MAG: hypothetical protein COV74_06725 [Candidatus Omnitrophica bacterium CG11_big_fil_rev_8_21_14_0_20_45_26]|uniref:Carbohydrate deacetylase n=1 Tax=Candidatus Abzuiibacterium crystallinum TaxID=1974748 RepID=A0A2H0LN69_9BACT|nr:MAG: hypothetical protein COV74_06725 [Candidatus Omnitrophica bacterium CG11_big_fil_rev_8_21_14_0_20_45_26]PIW65069.1 MAG: hypothetical protein COW12_03425 [Candidatus Omnitrophica bacterium CG12_big_fil_rev_8_21_14_0_65_45_16]